MKIFIFFLVLTCYCNVLQAQTCAAAKYPESYKTEKLFLEEEVRFETFLENNKNKISFRATPVIPVVFHIVYHTLDQDFTDAQVQQQLTILNRDFARKNPDTSKTPSVWKNIASDGGVQFCLAKRDPFGNTTLGIIHTHTNATELANINSVKSSSTGGDDIWNAKHYLNIWVTYIDQNTFGYAAFPTDLATYPQFDGVVINSKAFSISDSNFVYKNGARTLTHEVGHWLNLFHTFGTDVSVNCSTDFVDDTPPQQPDPKNAIHCLNFPKFDDCTFSGNGVMFMNYMNYVADSCYNLFTKGQRDRMMAALQMYRSDILNQETLCNLTGVNSVTQVLNFTIFPNPTSSGNISIEFENNSAPIADVFIFDNLGRMIQKKLEARLQNAPLNFSNLNTGFYIVRVTTENAAVCKSFMVIK